jgi:CRP/FNR family transcriptional regulator
MLRAQLFPFLGELSPKGRRELGALASTRVPPRKQLLRRGDAAGGAYLVLQGAMRVYYVTSEGREATLYRVEPGGTCVLALGATIHAAPYPAWVQSTRSGSTFVRVPTEAFHRWVDDEPAFRSFVMAAMSGRIFELMATLEELATTTVLQRVASYLVRSANGRDVVPGTQVTIASELGTAREVVFRALRALATRGLVASVRGGVRILDARGLAEAARRAE